uniref:Non-haem dioxygenase N-terminal domain-containing protein n=1 Tax=Salix viminalis TaxID=40686 RepID=A0A6N2NJY3_SALVM
MTRAHDIDNDDRNLPPHLCVFNKPSVFRHHAASPSNRTLSSRITCETMSSSTGTASPTLRSVTIPYADLKNKDADLSAKIEEGFGPTALGFFQFLIAEWCKRIPIAASLGLRLGGGGGGGPEFSSLRQNLLHLSPRLANLPQKVKDELEDPHSRYNFGWSHGKEKLESGKPDLLKGSFYANPILDVPTTDMFLKQRYPSYCSSNIWPDSALPELETALKALGKLMHDVGLMVAYHCDQYGKTLCPNYPKEWKWIKMKASNRYFFVLGVIKAGCFIIFLHQGDSDSVSSWCGWHTDHGSLTGLTCAMFKRDGVEIPCPDSTAGLYIKTRTDQIVKVVFGEGEIAYQIGETTEILSRGYLCATPHSVQAPKGEEVSGVDRSTFALFMQPDWDERLNFPKDMHIHKDARALHALDDVRPDATFKRRVRCDTVAGNGPPTSNPVRRLLVFLPVRRVASHGGRGRGGGRFKPVGPFLSPARQSAGEPPEFCINSFRSLDF